MKIDDWERNRILPYIDQGLSIRAVARQCGRDIKTVRKIVPEHRIASKSGP